MNVENETIGNFFSFEAFFKAQIKRVAITWLEFLSFYFRKLKIMFSNYLEFKTIAKCLENEFLKRKN